MAWLLAPAKPKEFTLALGTCDSGHARLAVTISTFHSSVRILGLIFFTPVVAGIIPFSRAKATLMMLDRPLAASL